jgi:hypothetical protein
MMTNSFFIDPRITDPEIVEDLTLTAEVVRQATECGDVLSQDEVDALLGLGPAKGSGT